MPRQLTRQQSLNTFVAGLNTESNPLLAPENSISAGDNVEILRNGTARRRRSLDLEQLGNFSRTQIPAVSLANYAITVHKWESVDGDDTLNFFVIQIGHSLYFHKAGAPVLSESILGSIDLNPIKVSDDFFKYPIESASGKGKLFIVSRKISPAYIQYNRDTGVFEGVKITLLVRDIEGIPEDIEAPVVFSDEDAQPPEPFPYYPGNPIEVADIIANLINTGNFSQFVPISIPGAF
jgi:hypothetical protein